MTPDQITALAREYAGEATKVDASDPNLSDSEINSIRKDVAEYAEWVIRFLLRRYCLVEKSRLKKLDIAYRAKEYDMVVLNKTDVDYLFPEIGEEVRNEQ